MGERGGGGVVEQAAASSPSLGLCFVSPEKVLDKISFGEVVVVYQSEIKYNLSDRFSLCLILIQMFRF